MSETDARHAADATPVEPVHEDVPEAQLGPAEGVGKHLPTDPGASMDRAADGGAHAPGEAEPDGDEEPRPEPSWWHRSHPTFAGLVGFFAGVAYVIIIPGVYATLLNWLVPEKTAQHLFPLVLIALIVPLGMLVVHKTRRFALFMFLGIVSTAVVVALTATIVLWVLVQGGK